MEKQFLIDTNVIIDFSGNRLPIKSKLFIAQLIDDEPLISIITKIELIGFSVVSQEIIEFAEMASVIGLTNAIANQTIALRKAHRIKIPDAIIAATALVHDFTLISRNVRDFDQISGLKVVNSYEL